MFYCDTWLKKGGRFYLCWLAASYPERLKGSVIRQLLSKDIRELSDDMQKLVSTESGVVQRRFSLRLSSQLFIGLVKLYDKKCSLFIVHLYHLNASINHRINYKWMAPSELEARKPRKRLTRLKLFTEELQDDGERVNIEEFPSNTVARIEDITLKDPVLPAFPMPERDDFGEMEEQAVGFDIMAEMMLTAGDPFALSVLDAERTHERLDRSRLSPMQGRMERLTEFDITLRDATRVEELMVPGEDIGREIPKISEIPIPEKSLPAPASTSKENRVTERERSMEDDEIVLENISDLPPPKRRKQGKLIIDKEIKLAPTAEWVALIEGRTKVTPARDFRADIDLVPAKMLMSRPARAGFNISPGLARLYTRNCQTTKTVSSDRMNIERRASTVRRAAQDPSEAPTQIVPPSKQPRLEEDQAPAKNSQVGDFSKSVGGELTHNGTDAGLNEATAQIEATQLDGKQPLIIESQPAFEKPRVPEKTTSPVQTNGKGLEAVANQEANDENGQTVRKAASHSSSETPLGSLDRTKVSLGEPAELTDSQISLKREWGVEGTMSKIAENITNNVKPLTLRRVVESGSTHPGSTRIAVALCFNSVLKLKQNGLIKVTKNPVTNEIEDIELGSKIIEHMRSD